MGKLDYIFRLEDGSALLFNFLYVNLWNDWEFLFGSQNWYNFTFLRLEGERTPYNFSTELSIGLLGCNVMFTVLDYNRTAKLDADPDNIINQAKEIAKKIIEEKEDK